MVCVVSNGNGDSTVGIRWVTTDVSVIDQIFPLAGKAVMDVIDEGNSSIARGTRDLVDSVTDSEGMFESNTP